MIAQKILDSFPHTKCFAFYAEMGSGKTTLIKAMCSVLGVTENTSSPTFSIINEYRGRNHLVIYHSDWYRLKGVEDAIEAGAEEILQNKSAYCFIEWPEMADPLLPDDCLHIKISTLAEDTRLLEI